MQIELSLTARIQLHAILNSQRVEISSLRTIWAIQDKIALRPEEERSIGLERISVAGGEQLKWKPEAACGTFAVHLSDAEVAKLRTVVGEWTFAAGDRAWLEPLLKLLSNSEPGEPANAVMHPPGLGNARVNGPATAR